MRQNPRSLRAPRELASIPGRPSYAFEDLIGVSWKRHGRDVEGGLDCLGLILVILDRLGRTFVELPDESRARAYERLREWFVESDAKSPPVGSVLLFEDTATPHLAYVETMRTAIEAVLDTGTVRTPLRYLMPRQPRIMVLR